MSELIHTEKCPFCGDEERIRIMATGCDDSGYQYYIECGTCGARSRLCNTVYDALIAWNERENDD